MKKGLLLYAAAIVLIASFVGTSCKKIIHANQPTPNNVRVMGYTKLTTIKNTVPIAGEPSDISEKFRFYYDEGNRLSRIIYTGNDSFAIHEDIEFKYIGDTILKITKNILNSSYVKTDTFVLGSNGLVKYAITDDSIVNEYKYYGKLLSRNITSVTNHRHMMMGTETYYTSVNGDFLKNYYDGKLITTFDGLTAPYMWIRHIQDGSDTTEVIDYDSGTDPITYVIEGYNTRPLYMIVHDTARRVDSMIYPGLNWSEESYHFYTEDANRVGDYLWLESFTWCGQNIYQNAHLVESIANGSKNAYIKYAIDAQSKITQTRVELVDSLLNKYTMVYDIQYETY